MRYSILYAKIMIYNYGVVCAFFAAANSIPSLFRNMNPRNGGIAMKSTVKHTRRSLMSILLALCMLVSCITVGLVPTDAAKIESQLVGGSWISFKRLYFGVPTAWSNSFTNVYAAARQSNGYCVIIGKLTEQVSGSRIYGTTTGQNIDHSSWGDEYLYIFATNSEYTVGSAYNTISKVYATSTTTSSMVAISSLNNTSNNYFIYPTSNSDGAAISSRWNNYGDMGYLGTDGSIESGQGDTPYAQQKTSCSTGGSATISGYRITAETAASFSSHSSTTGQLGCIVGSKVTVTASANSGYKFDGFYSNSNYSTKITSGVSGNTYTYTVTSTNDNTVYLKFSPNETTYSVSVVSEDTSKGTVAASTVNAGATTAVTIPEATPKYGYRFKQWVATSPATIASGSTSATAGKVKATGTGGTVTAQFEPDPNMNLYIAGRFHIRNGTSGDDWINSFDTGDWSEKGDGNIKFTYVSGTTYKVETNASVSELSHSISEMAPYFFVYDTGASKGWHPTASTHFNGTTTSASLTTNTATNNVRFEDSDNNDTPVTLFFDTATKTLSYSVPTYYTVTCNTATGGSVTANVARQKQGETVTLTLSPSAGYNIGTVTVKDASNNTVSLSGSGATRTFTMPASAVTVTATFTEIMRTVTVYKRYTKQDGTKTTDSTATQTITNVGIATSATVNAAAAVADYTFSTFTLPDTVTVKTGSASNASAFTITATANSTIYIDYTETIYTLTLANQGYHGTIKKNGTSTAIKSIQVGNVTGVTLVATPNIGYEFAGWEKTTNASAITIGNAASNSTTFKISGNATVTAQYNATQYTIIVSGSPAAGAATLIPTDTSGRTKTGGIYNDVFEIRITVNTAAGYALADNPISFQTRTGYATPTLQSGYPQTTGNTTIYRYKLGNGNVNATVSFKAATPTISSVRIRNNTQLTTDIDSCTEYNDGATVNTYYKQPLEAKVTTSDDFTSTLNYATLTTGNVAIGSDTSTPCSIAADPSIIPTTETDYKTYTFTVTATNSPEGVAPAFTYRTYTIQVYFNDAQKAYFRLNTLYSRCVENDSASYYKEGAPLSTYNTAYASAKTFINAGYPVYNPTEADITEAENKYNSFETAYTNLMKYAKTTTVYVLTNYASSSENPINVLFSSNGTADDWNHLRMYNTSVNNAATLSASDETRHLTYEGYITKTSNRYLYSITYAGHANIRIWRGANAADASLTNGEQLTGIITGATGFKDYYVNIFAASAGSGATSTAISEYSDFDHSINTGKKFLELGDVKTGSDIKTLFNITPTGSIVSDPGIDNLTTTNNTAFTIEGPVDKGLHTITDLKTTSFKAEKQGRYIVKYTTKFGKNASGNDITRTKEMTLYVAFDEVSVYVDMNDNIGTPILNFKYWQNNQTQTPVESTESGATEAYLPYEMELVTGSESIYKCTIKTSDLHKTYFLKFDADHPLTISYITVERVNYSGAGGAGFDILSEARITGEIWLKADSTNLTTFKTISCGSVTKTFVAALDNGEENKSIIPEAVELLHGTGINTDVEEVYNSQYAGLYLLENPTTHVNELMDDFHYVLNASVKPEVRLGSNTCYFDKWVVCSSASVSYPKNEMTDELMVSYPGSSEVAGTTTAMNFTSAQEYGDGDNDVTYIAVYKLVDRNKPVRVETTYKFKDYDTSDGNYVFDATRDVVDASYTKTITTDSTSMSDVRSSLESIAQNNAPFIRSNYFDYSFKTNSLTIVSEKESESKFVITVELTHTPHPYRIILKKGDTIVSNTTGYYQQTKNLSSGGCANPVWKDSSGNILGSGTTDSTFAARYVSSGNERDDNADCQVIKVENGTSTAANNKSVVSNAYTEVYYTDNGTEMLRHNFYIIDYCAAGKLVGGGVLFATTDANGNYRQQNAGTHLADSTTRTNYIQSIINPVDPNNAQQRLDYFDVEFEAQTVNNVGFRYKPFKSTEDVYRYSDDLNAYITIFEGTNVNSSNYEGQKLRLFSFMVYDNNGTKVIVPSDGYAQVERYQPQSH